MFLPHLRQSFGSCFTLQQGERFECTSYREKNPWKKKTSTPESVGFLLQPLHALLISAFEESLARGDLQGGSCSPSKRSAPLLLPN